MNKKPKYFICALIVVVAVVATFSNTKNNPIAQSETFSIGVITPLTGQYAFIGEANRNAILLAQRQFGDTFGPDKNSKKVEVFFEDDKYDAKLAVTAYKKLRDINHIDAVIVLGAPSIQALKPLTDSDNIPLLGLGGTIVYEKDTVFQLMPLGNLMFPTLGKVYGEKYKHIVVAQSSAALFAENARMFTTGLPSDVKHEKVIINPAADFRTEVEKIVRTNPDAVTVFLPKDDAIKFLKALRVSDREGKIKIVCDFGVEIAVKEYENAIGKDRLDGCISTNLAVTVKDKFKTDYMTQYKIEPAVTADYAYDAYQLVTQLAQSTPKEKWVEKVSSKGFVFEGNASGKMEFNDDGSRLDVPPVVRQYKNGKFVEIDSN